MLTLAPPLPSSAAPPRAAPPDRPAFARITSGRSLADYARVFAFEVIAWRGRDVLDVAAGTSSFVAEACARRINAVAVDPIYSRPEEFLDDACAGSAGFAGWPQGAAAPLRNDRPGNTARHGVVSRPIHSRPFMPADADRRTPAERFRDDYQAHYAHGRYVAGALPRLPFFDATFDLVLCGRLLFAGSDEFDVEAQVAACRDLVRVSAGETRLHPVCRSDGRLFPGVARLRRELKAVGIGSELSTVESNFGAGEDSMLVLKRLAS
ncbi:MAG: methyltransferase [Opitutaceae bacterium]|nr:methyltransferase [Opitutaceae bacterium]